MSIDQKQKDRFRKMFEGVEVDYDPKDIIEVPIDQLIPNAYNPNQQEVETFNDLVQSILDDGMTTPLKVNMQWVIVDGEHRWRAAQVAGLTTVPVVQADYTEAEMREGTLAYNMARGRHDSRAEALVFQDIVAEGGDDWAKEALNLTDGDIRHLRTIENEIVTPKITPEDTPITTAEKVEEARRRTEALRQKREELMKAQSAIEKAGTFRLALTFSSDEGRIVRKVLGKDRARMIVMLCERYG